MDNWLRIRLSGPFLRSFSSNSYGYSPQTIEKIGSNSRILAQSPQTRQAPSCGWRRRGPVPARYFAARGWYVPGVDRNEMARRFQLLIAMIASDKSVSSFSLKCLRVAA